MSRPATVFVPIGRHPALPAIDPAHAEAALALYGRRFDVPMSATESLRVCFAEAAPAELALQLGVRCAGHDYDLQVSDPAALSSRFPMARSSAPRRSTSPAATRASTRATAIRWCYRSTAAWRWRTSITT